MKYNELDVGNNIILYSTDKSKDYSTWGLYDKTSGKDILPPTYSYDGRGIHNRQDVLCFREGSSKKIYLIEKRKLLFNDYDLICKVWNDLPEFYSKNHGYIYYVMKDDLFCLVNENGKVLHESDMPFPGAFKIFDDGKKTMLFTSKEVIDIDSKKPVNTDNRGKIVDTFVVNGNVFYVFSYNNGSFVKQYYLMHWDTKKVVIEFFGYDKKDWYATTSSALYVKSDMDECIKYNELGDKIKEFKHLMSGLMVIDDKVIVGLFDKGYTIDLDTGRKVMDGVAYELIKDSHLVITSSTKGLYKGIKNFDTNKVLAPAIFDSIKLEPKITCQINKKGIFNFDFFKKSFTSSAKHDLVPVMFNISWTDRIWE